MSAAEGSSASIGKSVEVRGEVKGSEDLMIDGRVEGTVTLTDSKLTIGSSARVDADVAARDVIILGMLNGNVTAAARVELRKGGNLTGNIRAARLSIEEGALLTGKVELTQTGPTSTKASPLASPAAGSPAPSSGGYPPVSTA